MITSTLDKFIAEQKARTTNEDIRREWNALRQDIEEHSLETVGPQVRDTPFDGTPRTLVYLVFSLEVYPPQNQFAPVLLQEVKDKYERVGAESSEGVVLRGLIAGLDDVVRGYIPLVRVIYALVDAYNDEQLNVPPQPHIIGVDEASDAQRKHLYTIYIDKMRRLGN